MMTTTTKLSANILEFKFELANLPIQIPSIRYPPLQYNNLSMQDFTGEFKVMNDFLQGSDMEDESDDQNSGKKSVLLPQGFEYRATFKCHRRNIFTKVNKQVAETQLVTDFSHYIVAGETVLLHFMSDLLLKRHSDSVLNGGLQCLGEALISNLFCQQCPSQSSSFLKSLDKRVLEIYERIQKAVNERLQSIQQENYKQPLDNAAEDVESVAYTGHLLSFSILMINGCGVEAYFNVQKSIKLAFELHVNLIEKTLMRPQPIITFLQSNLHHNILNINIASYYPQFLFEIESNLRSLEFIFNASASISDVGEVKQKFLNLQSQYLRLMKFLREKVLTIVFSMRNEQLVTTYPLNEIYKVFKEWHRLCPSYAMAYSPKSPKSNSRYYDEFEFLENLSTTLYIYYYAIAVSLDAIFPACKYLFNLGFILPTTGKLKEKDILTVSKYNRFSKTYFNQRIDGMLQRHICYASRVFAFFKRRFIFYNNHTSWSNYYDNITSANRFDTRKITNVKEVPIHSFSTTLIRPEHYPTRESLAEQSKPSFISFNREDYLMAKNSYGRNIETLDIFNESVLLQCDYDSMLLLKDYRPLDDCLRNTRGLLELTDIRDYYEDKYLIMSTLTNV
ncbi:hypothetical protein KGF56_001834 [Candida oxycetoniae]|uniref:Uncharacterized protein n=1 Tax=Candida oxycetoniae TaxID=497107 RepID=A0AAI9SYI4_9ASCO|nr:uncharacterized protein KGF56_001834 [Candida oxycetoniae]KAI3405337.2 hypothetical protein KGF56_001834 [Candida oxycetoniae]